MDEARPTDEPTPALQARVGRCERCRSFVYDLEGLSEEDARRLVLATEGRVVTRLVYRRDGRCMTVDCGHGTGAWPDRRRLLAGALAAAVLVVLGLGVRVLVVERTAPTFAPVAMLDPKPPAASPAAAPQPQSQRGDDSAQWPAPPSSVHAVPSLWLPSGSGSSPHHLGPGWVGPGFEGSAQAAAQPRAPAPINRLDLGGLAPGSSDGPPAAIRPQEPRGRRDEADGFDLTLADVHGSWPTTEVQRSTLVEALEARLAPLRTCYRRLLQRTPMLRGAVSVRLRLEDDGHVQFVSLPLEKNLKTAEPLEQCTRAAFTDARFPAWGQGSLSARLIFAGAR